MFKYRFLNFLAAEVHAAANGRFGFLWIGAFLLALAAWGISAAAIAGRIGWLPAVPLALAAGLVSGGAAYWSALFFSVLLLDKLSTSPRFAVLPLPPNTPEQHH